MRAHHPRGNHDFILRREKSDSNRSEIVEAASKQAKRGVGAGGEGRVVAVLDSAGAAEVELLEIGTPFFGFSLCGCE